MKKLALVVLLAAVPLWAQTSKIQVKFECQCNDSTGAAFATAFRDLLASSPRYVETSDISELGADGKSPIWHLKIDAISLDPSVNRVGNEGVISVVFLIGNSIFIDHVAQWCKRDNVSTCAKDTFAIFDKDLNAR